MQTDQDAHTFIMVRNCVLTGQPIIGRFLPLSLLQTLPSARFSFLMYSSSGTTISISHSLGINGHQLNHTSSMPLSFSLSMTRAQQFCQPYTENIPLLHIFFESPLNFPIIFLCMSQKLHSLVHYSSHTVLSLCFCYATLPYISQTTGDLSV
jgi:hypothetical protein